MNTKTPRLTTALIFSLAGALAGLAAPTAAQISADQAQSAGPGHPWQGALPGVNPFSLSRETDIPLVAWTARGGLPISFSLHHSSQALASNATIAPKWTHSYDTHIETWVDQGIQMAAVVWGDQRTERFALANNLWSPLDGYRDALSATANGYLLTLKSGDKLEFVSTPQQGRYRLWKVTDPNNNKITLSYDGLGRLTKVADPNARAIRLSYSATTGKLSKVKFVAGTFTRQWSIAYNAQTGQVASITWPIVTTDAGDQSLKAKFTYDASGNITTLTDRAGKQWKYGYTGSTLAWAQWPGNANNQRITYSSQNGATSVTDAGGVRTTYEYDGMSRLIRVKDADGNTLSRSYADPDYPWLPSLITSPTGATTAADYDSRGNAVALIDAAGHRTDLTWDARNRLTTVLEPLVTDAWGTTEPFRHETSFVYDNKSNLIKQRQKLAADSFFDIMYTVDLHGLITSRSVMGNTTNFAYDAYGNPTSATTPAGRTSQMLYESADATHGFTAPSARIDALGLRAGLTYDQWGRLRSMNNPDGSGANYAYDPMNRLVKMSDNSGATTWSYNAAGLPTDESNARGAIHTDYSPSGLPKMLTESSLAGQRTIQYTYDSRGLVASLSSVDNDDSEVVFCSYNPDGRLANKSLSNGAHTTYAYAANRLASITHFDASNNILASFAYDYQANGLRAAAHDSDGSLTRYGYDPLNRPAREERSGGASPYTLSWSYDSAGNRTKEVRNGAPTSFSYDPDGLVQNANTPGGPNTYQWDANARLAQRTVNGVSDHFAYDFQGRLTRIYEFNGMQWMPSREYRYDGLDRRIQRQTFGTYGEPVESITFTYDAFTPLGQVSQSQHGLSSAAMTFAAGLAAYVDDQGAFFPATDASGSIRAATDASGHSVGLQASFDIFGNPTAQDVQWIPFSLAADSGARTDGDAGLTYSCGRYYDPAIACPITFEPLPPRRPAIFTAGITTDVGELTAQVSAQELNFQTDGPIICQALFQRLAPRAPFAQIPLDSMLPGPNFQLAPAANSWLWELLKQAYIHALIQKFKNKGGNWGGPFTVPRLQKMLEGGVTDQEFKDAVEVFEFWFK